MHANIREVQRKPHLMAVALLGYLRSFLVPCLASVCCVSADVAADVVGSSMALAAASSSASAQAGSPHLIYPTPSELVSRQEHLSLVRRLFSSCLGTLCCVQGMRTLQGDRSAAEVDHLAP